MGILFSEQLKSRDFFPLPQPRLLDLSQIQSQCKLLLAISVFGRIRTDFGQMSVCSSKWEKNTCVFGQYKYEYLNTFLRQKVWLEIVFMYASKISFILCCCPFSLTRLDVNGPH